MKILITNLFIKEYTGSEINCLEISRCLKNMGHTPYVYTFYKENPLCAEFEKNKIFVSDQYEDIINIEFDLIWNQHSQVLNYLLFRRIKYKNILFSSLSPFEELEYPSYYVNQLPLVLANSKETKNKLVQLGVKPELINIFFNSVDLDYFKASKKESVSPIKALCISNHPPEELLNLKVFTNNNFSIDFIGQNSGEYKLVTPDVLNNYNLIISIGKTVQYAIALNIPIYCYDQFGGPGFITQNNCEIALNHNFSGRGFSKKTTSEIYNELISVSPNIEELNLLLSNKFNLKKNILEVLTKINHLSTPPIAIVDHQAAQFKKIFIHYIDMQKAVKYRDGIIRQQIIEIDKNKTGLTLLNNELNWITNSKWWKLRALIYSLLPKRLRV
jgi:hypothetical protein